MRSIWGWACLCGAIAAMLVWCGSAGGRGDTATVDGVVRGLESTGFELTYRKMPRVPGFEFVGGRARGRRGGVVDFVVRVRTAARGEVRAPAQPQLLRYDYEMRSVRAGNVVVWAQQQAPEERGRHFFVLDPEETRMVVKIDLAATRDIAPQFHEGI
jgi:hypothetical protein